jgi:hypothetical protein
LSPACRHQLEWVDRLEKIAGDGSSWDRSLSMNIHVPSDRNLSTTTSLAFGVGWIPTGLFLGTESPHRRSRIIGHLVDDEEDLSPVVDHNGIPLAW